MEDKKLNFSDEVQGKQLIFTRKKIGIKQDKTSTSVFHADSSTKGDFVIVNRTPQ
jgi:hypothetical protein